MWLVAVYVNTPVFDRQTSSSADFSPPELNPLSLLVIIGSLFTGRKF